MRILIEILTWLADDANSESASASRGHPGEAAATVRPDAAMDYALSGLDPAGDSNVDYGLYLAYKDQL